MDDSRYASFLDAVHGYLDRGWTPIPVPSQSKAPVIPDWQKLTVTSEELPALFPVVSNVGVLLGEPSGNLIDIDLDVPEAVHLADAFLPATSARFGHGGGPASHWLYRGSDPGKTIRFRDPLPTTDGQRSTLVELRFTGAQTLVPPSIHPCGETISWEEDGEPTPVDGENLANAVAKLAAAVLLVRHWPGEGQRHETAMAIAGGLLRAGWDQDEVGRFVGLIACTAGDTEVMDRMRSVESTASALAKSGSTTGWPRLKTLLDPRLVDAVTGWLGIGNDRVDSLTSFDSLLRSQEERADAPPRDPLRNERQARTIAVPPFPLSVFPPLIRQYIEDGARSVGCPPDMIAVPFLGYAASANGRQRRVRIKGSWVRKSTVWTGVVAGSGDGKSPADSYARAPLDILQAEAHQTYTEQLTVFKRELAQWKAADPTTRGDEPLPPTYEHWYTTDPTVESLAPMLQTASGLAVAFDELVAWARGCNSYKRGGNDRQKYLELWNGRALKIDRRTQGTIFVEDPVCCLIGGIQPERLPEMSREGSIHDGLIPRFLWTYPDVEPTSWRWEEATSDVRDLMVDIFRSLRTTPVRTLTMHTDARTRWEDWYNQNEVERRRLPALAQEVTSKLPAHLATLWLVLHCLWDPEGEEHQVGLAQFDGAIALIEYFRAHARRVLVHFGTSAPEVEAGVTGRVATILREQPDWIGRTELSNALHRNVKADTLDAALATLLAEGRVERADEGEGVRARILWRWIDVDDEWPENEVNEGTNQRSDRPIDSFTSYEVMSLPSIDTAAVNNTRCFACGGTNYYADGVCRTCHPRSWLQGEATA